MKVAVLVLTIVGVVCSFAVGACTGACFTNIGDMQKNFGANSEADKSNQEAAGFFGWALLQALIGIFGGTYAFVRFENRTKARIAGVIILIAAAITIHNTFQFFTAGILFGVAGLLAIIGAGRTKTVQVVA